VKVKELLTQKTWIKGSMAALARPKKASYVHPKSPNATCWCLEGALHRCYDTKHERYWARVAVIRVISELYPNRSMDIILFNDAPETKWKDVQRVIMHADV
jgi:hypothetical protein